MPHDNHCGCGCGHDHDPGQKASIPAGSDAVTKNQMEFLHQLHHHRFLPVARFTLTNSREPDFISTALSPVFIRNSSDDMPTVKEAGAFLRQLEQMGMITLDYDIPLDGYAYEEYKDSALYAYFCKTVAESANKPDFLGDTPQLDLGSMALTEEGEKIAAGCCGQGHHCH